MNNQTPYNITSAELAEVSWERNPQFGQSSETVAMRKILNAIYSIWHEPDNRIWSLLPDEPKPEPKFVEDETIIPFWYGVEPEKKTIWKRIKNLLTW